MWFMKPSSGMWLAMDILYIIWYYKNEMVVPKADMVSPEASLPSK